MSSTSKKKRRGRKPNSLKQLYNLPPEQPKKKDLPEHEKCYQKSKKRKASSSRWKKGVNF